jgi:predicted transcriptional regulator
VSRQLITEYRSELDRIHAASGSKRESVVREAFKDLLRRAVAAAIRDGNRAAQEGCLSGIRSA